MAEETNTSEKVSDTMFYRRNAIAKWVGLSAVVLLVGWYFWHSGNLEGDTAWLDEMAGGGTSVGGSSASHDKVPTGKTERTSTLYNIVVHAAGAVKNPGVYYLPQDARIIDLLKAAGGVGNDADLNELNLAEPLSDGEKVYVPLREIGRTPNQTEHTTYNSAYNPTYKSTTNSTANSKYGSTYNAQGHTASSQTRTGNTSTAKVSQTYANSTSNAHYSEGTATSSAYNTTGIGTSGNSIGSGGGYRRGGKVNINTASIEELMSLSGVGPSRAEGIVQYRNEHGRFQQLQDLKKVNGIGDKTFAKLESSITIY